MKKVDRLTFLLFFCAWCYFLVIAVLVGPFTRILVTPISSSYPFTAVMYSVAGLVLSYVLGIRSLLYLAVAAGFQEGTWNLAYISLHPDFLGAALRANGYWPLYMSTLLSVAIFIFLFYRKRFIFTLRDWTIFGIFYGLYILVGMPITATSGAWGSIWEAAYVILSLTIVGFLSNRELKGILSKGKP